MPWLTGNNAAAGTICRRVLIPADINLRAAVNGAISALTQECNWQQFGSLTPAECAELMSAMYDAFLADDCDCPEDARMIGTIVPYATVSPPTGCLSCDGELYLIADYPVLAAALDPAFIVSGTHFRTPDLRGRTVIGAGTGAGLTARAVGATGGAENHTLTIAQMPSHTHPQGVHTHTVTDPGHTHTVTDPGHAHTVPGRSATADGTGVPRLANSATSTTNNNTSNVTTGVSVNVASTGITIGGGLAELGPSGGGAAHNNMQPFFALKYAIVALP